MAEDIKYYYDESTLQEYQLNKNYYNSFISSGEDPYGSNNHKIVSQCWKGYYSEKFFNECTDKPQGLRFLNAGSNVLNKSCCPCSIMAARDWMMNITDDNQRYKLQEMRDQGYTDKTYHIGQNIYTYESSDTKCYRFGRFDVSERYPREIPQTSTNFTYANVHKIYDPEIDAEFLNAYDNVTPDMFYIPTDSKDVLYREIYNQDKKYGLPQGVSLTDDYKISQVRAMMIIEYELKYNRPTMLFFGGPKHQCGHFILASKFTHTHGNNIYSLGDLTVLDSCPKDAYTSSYWGVEIPFTQAQARKKDDLSDGISRVYKFYFKDNRRN